MAFTTDLVPVLETGRLVLRPFELSDAKRVQALAGDYELAKTTATVPHPYEDGMAEGWISGHAENWREGRDGVWAVTNRADGDLGRALIGCINISLSSQHETGEIGYWVGRPFWGKGYGTEAAQAVMDYSFRTLNLHRIFARHMSKNPASGRIMQKIGMTYEGTLREAEIRWGARDSICFYGILRHEWATDQSSI